MWRGWSVQLWWFWLLSGIAGTTTLFALLLLFSLVPHNIIVGLVLILPGTVVGVCQRPLLRRRYRIPVSRLWLAGAAVSACVWLAYAADGLNYGALAVGGAWFGALAGWIQHCALPESLRRRERWIWLSTLGHATGSPIGWWATASLPALAPVHGILVLPAVAACTGLCLRWL